MEKQKKRHGLLGTAIFVAFVFIFNPNLNIVDILPDFIGYAILYAALSRLALLNDTVELAQKGFFRAIWLDVGKLCFLMLVFATQNPNEQNTMLLLGSFAFSVAELIVLIPAFTNLFSGFINLGYKHENSSVLGYRKERSRKNRTEKMRSFTIFFLTVKALAATLPEFAVLSTQNYDDNKASTLYIYDFVGLLRSFAIVICLTVGVIWLVRVISYFASVRKDRAFMESLLEDYSRNILPRTSIFVRRSVKLVFLIFSAAALLCTDLRIENFNILIDTFAAIALIISVFVARRYLLKSKKIIIPFAVYAVLSLVAVIFEYGFFSEHYYSAIWRDDVAYNAYVFMLVWCVLDAAAFLCAVWGMGQIIRGIIKDHTGFYVPNASINVDDKIKRVHRELNKKVYLLYAAGIISAAADLFYDFGAHTYRFAGFVNTLCSFAFFVAVFFVTDAVGDEVESKYMLE